MARVKLNGRLLPLLDKAVRKYAKKHRDVRPSVSLNVEYLIKKGLEAEGEL